MRMPKLQIRTQLGLCFAIAMWLPVAVEGLGVKKLSDYNDSFKQLADNQVPALATAYAWESHLQDAAVRMSEILNSGNPNEIQLQLSAIRAEQLSSKEAMDRTSASMASPNAPAALQELLTAWANYAPKEEKFIELLVAGNRAAAEKFLFEEVRPSQIENVKALDRLIESEKSAVTAGALVTSQRYEASRKALLACSLLAFVIGSIASGYVIVSLRDGLGGDLDYAAEIANRIASGEFNMEIRASYGDGSSLLATMGSMRDNLLKIVSHVSQAATSVCQGTAKLSQDNDELSVRTQEQARALAATSANIEELTISVKQNADNARRTTQRAILVCNQAEGGGAVVQRAVAAMAEISASSRKIVDIIGVIDEIAFQTNLLALNAAVEAARAGEQGRGFAVVASEVGSLAQRSATAARQIKSLITESVTKVEIGAQLIDESGKTLIEIIVGVKKVADVIAEIAAASERQAEGIDEVNSAVARMDATTQQNSALVDRGASTSKEIQRQAEDLAAKVAFFRTDESDSTSIAAVPVN
jgi:methyl-accepting chemotaxis protein